jgi:hypothetical protein
MTFNWRDNTLLKLTNIFVFSALFGVKLYNVLDTFGADIKETYISPSSYFFSIWVLIDLLLAGYVVFQFFDQSSDIVNGIGYRFALVAVFNTVFLNLYATQHYIAGFIFAVLLSSSVSHVYYILKNNFCITSVSDGLFVHLPFSLWHAFSIAITFDAGFAAFTSGVKEGGPGELVKILVVISELVLTSTALGYGFQSRKGDAAGGLVIGAFLVGIFIHQEDAVIRWVALGGGVLADVAAVKSLYYTFLDTSGVIVLTEESA